MWLLLSFYRDFIFHMILINSHNKDKIIFIVTFSPDFFLLPSSIAFSFEFWWELGSHSVACHHHYHHLSLYHHYWCHTIISWSLSFGGVGDFKGEDNLPLSYFWSFPTHLSLSPPGLSSCICIVSWGFLQWIGDNFWWKASSFGGCILTGEASFVYI